MNIITWGPPAEPVERGAREWFRCHIRPTLASDDPIALFHKAIESDTPVPAPLVTRYLSYLDTIAAQGQAPTAWASINAALFEAINNDHLSVVRELLSVSHWQVCDKNDLGHVAVFYPHYKMRETYHEMLHLLAADARFAAGQGMFGTMIQSRIATIGPWAGNKSLPILQACLSVPQFHAHLLWDHALAKAMTIVAQPDSEDFALPSIFSFDVLMDTAEWQFERARNRWKQSNQDQLEVLPVPPRLSAPPAFPGLLVQLPLDLQLQLHGMLDMSTLRAIRLTCRALRHFPMDRFVPLRLERTLEWLSSNPLSYDSGRLETAIESIPGHAGPSVMDYRALVEAVRHLDIDLALRFLCPLDRDIAQGFDLRRARNPAFRGSHVPWALWVLLKQLSASDLPPDQDKWERGGILLRALLLHPTMTTDAWSLVLYRFGLCRSALVAAAASTDERIKAALSRISDAVGTSDPSLALVFVRLVQVGQLMEPVPATILGELHTREPVMDAYSTLTRVFILFCTLSSDPATFTSLVRLFPTPLPLSTKTTLLAAACYRPDPECYFTHVLSTLAPVPEHVLRAPVAARAKQALDEDVVDQVLPHLTQESLRTLLFPTSTPMAPTVVKINARILTHWFHQAIHGEDEESGQEQVVAWKGQADTAKLLVGLLQKLERKGSDQAAAERRRELVAAWEAWNQEQGLSTNRKCMVQ